MASTGHHSMQDPHVVSLQYRLQNNDCISYADPPPIKVETDAFSIRLADGVLAVQMKEHFPSIEAARQEVDEYLRAWEIDADLRFGPGALHFAFEDGDVVDRDPPPEQPGVIECQAGVIESSGCCALISSVTPRVVRGSYPQAPTRFRINPDVDTLWQRFEGYRKGREPLLAMAYFCLSLIEWCAGVRRGRRAAAARLFSIDEQVLDKLGKITSEGGDATSARKVSRQSAMKPITTAESAWTEAAVKALIRRVGEFDPSNPLPPLTMSDLPAL